MSWYDEPPEPTEEEINLHYGVQEAMENNGTVQLALPDWVIEKVVDHAAHLALAGMKDKAKQAVQDSVDEAVRAAAGEIVREKVEPIIDAQLKEGWPVTDSYGRPNGRVTVESLVASELTKADNYDRESWINKQVKAQISKLVDAALKAELDAARAKLRAELDGVLKAKIAETIRDAVGLK